MARERKGRLMIVPCEVLEELMENFIGKRGPKKLERDIRKQEPQ
jgi:hypothetical protein